MRIVFTMRIASVISEVDVSHNGLFIGLWTEAEVSLGFIVACSLCLPKLIKVKGKKLKPTLFWISAPLPSLSSKSRKSSLWGGSRKNMQPESKAVQQMKHVDEERQMYFEEREERQQQIQAKLQPGKHRHDIYVLPSTAGSSEYSQSMYSQNDALERISEGRDRIQVIDLARSEISRSISVYTQEVPVRLDAVNMSFQRLGDAIKVFQEFGFDTSQVSINSQRRRESV